MTPREIIGQVARRHVSNRRIRRMRRWGRFLQKHHAVFVAQHEDKTDANERRTRIAARRFAMANAIEAPGPSFVVPMLLRDAL